MKIVICDDNERFVKQIFLYHQIYEEKYAEKMNVYCCRNGNELLSFLRETQGKDSDLIFLDIMFKDDNGIKIAKEIRKFNKKIKIVFLSAFDKYAVEGYEVEALKYLVKPISYERFEKEMELFVSRINEDNKLFFWHNTDKGRVKIDFSEIVYIDILNRKINIHTMSETYHSYGKMKEYERILSNNSFCRCHAAYIVNLQYIRRINGQVLYLDNGWEIPISKNRKKQFMQIFAGFVEKRI